MLYQEKLQEICEQIKKGIRPEAVSARTFIGWFGAERRSFWNVRVIRKGLSEYQLLTDPDFESVYIDAPVCFVAAPQKNRAGSQEAPPADVSGEPTYRIGKLASANKTLVAVKPDDSIEAAVMLMINHDYSQLPVMTTERDVKGMISWESLGSQLALGKKPKCVRECMVPHKEISYDTYIFAAVDDIIMTQYALIRTSQNTISGIVTTSDLSLQFRQLGEPFLLLGEIENYIRLIVQDTFTKAELTAACGPGTPDRDIQGVADLTLGEYLRLLENPEKWDKLGIPLDRALFVEKLEDIRRIRNDIMHFDPDGITEEDVGRLRDFVRIMHTLARAGMIRGR